MSRSTLAAFFAVPLVFAGCGGSSDTASHEPAVVEEVAGTDLSRITLTPEAAERLDIKTGNVERSGDTTLIPYSAVFYSPTGETWTYTNPEGLTFVRQRIDVDSIDGARARLSKGPEPGTKVATVGVAELYGTESGLGADSGH
ncbi:MAG TPA: hypothetical protein VFG93_06635 [Gaiellaceae bacterium]|nr:hypothetical protein [Gaiellaceae bacterium]